MDPDPANIMPQLILIFILVLVNAFFASAEMAIVSLNKNKLRMMAEEGNKKAKQLEKLIKEPTKFLSTIQVGITLAGFFSSASAATGISGYVGGYFTELGVPYAEPISLVIVTILLAYVTLVFGELYPKRVALQKAESIAMFSVAPILLMQKIASPFIKLLSLSTNFMIRVTGMKVDGLDEKISKEEIRSLVEVGEEHGVINEIEKDMINSVFEFDDIIAEEIMTPRTDVYMIDIERPLCEYIDEMLEEKYSRIPIFEDDIDNIIGVLYMKDFIVEAKKVGFEDVNIRNIMHTPFFVPERKNIDELFKQLQSANKYIAILIDEYGGFSGIVTIEDLIEEIMGEIDDEYDKDDPDIRVVDSSTFIVKGSTSIQDLNSSLHLDLDENSQDYDTVGGLIINLLGYIPIDHEQPTIEYGDLTFKIETAKDKRIEYAKIFKQPNGITNKGRE